MLLCTVYSVPFSESPRGDHHGAWGVFESTSRIGFHKPRPLGGTLVPKEGFTAATKAKTRATIYVAWCISKFIGRSDIQSYGGLALN
jgi:hypothetical protein